MTEDWLRGDPFSDPADPHAAARDERRREREARRRERDASETEAPAAPSPPAPPPRSPEQEFWDEEPGASEGAPPPPPPPPARGPRPPGRWSGALGALRRHPVRIIAALLALALLWFLVALFQPFHGSGSGRVVVRIPKGAGVSEVGDILDDRG